MIHRILVAGALSLGLAATAHAGEFQCSAWIGAPGATAPPSSNFFGGPTIKAPDARTAAELYQARISETTLPLKTGRWIVHHVRCDELK